MRARTSVRTIAPVQSMVAPTLAATMPSVSGVARRAPLAPAAHRPFLPVLLLASLAAAGGCSTAGDILAVSEVRPWERDTLARDDMRLVTDVMDDTVDDHMYFSKEASTGGGSVRGGGCGCN